MMSKKLRIGAFVFTYSDTETFLPTYLPSNRDPKHDHVPMRAENQIRCLVAAAAAVD